ncbi:MAG TPA: site-2 protease family protein [Candidatus Limnocylindria bacterium]|nr:site-2 protease family protein [Candidatus Limnocylindria bacterium]
MLFFNLTAPQIVGIAIALVVGITFHEFSHAFVADQLGDHRPRAMGRVSLNPAAHIDPMGALFFVIAGFGWGKPVMVNGYALRPGRIGLSMVAAAGPIANVLVALVFAVLFRALFMLELGNEFVFNVVIYTIMYNLALALFNLLPIPPLDGYNLALGLLPPRQSFLLQRYAQYGFLVLLGVILLSYTMPGGGPIGWLFALARAGTNLLTGLTLV